MSGDQVSSVGFAGQNSTQRACYIDLSALFGIVRGDIVIIVDRTGCLRWANRQAEYSTGWRFDELEGRSVIELLHDDDQPTALGGLSSLDEDPVGDVIDVRVRTSVGTYRHFEVYGRAAFDDPHLKGLVVIGRDVTELRRSELGGGNTQLLQAIVDHTPAITMLLSADGMIRGISRAFTSFTGRRVVPVIGRHVRELVALEDQAALGDQLLLLTEGIQRTTFEASFTVVGQPTPLPMSLTAVNLLNDEAVEGIILTGTDISALVEARERFRHLATHDALTGLPNRSVAIDRLETALRTTPASTIAVVFCDLDGFKAINDRYGHRAGDHVLIQFAQRLNRITREQDLAARISGDEFVLVLQGFHERYVSAFAERIKRAATEPIVLPSGTEVIVPVSVGIAVGGSSDDIPSCSHAPMKPCTGPSAVQTRGTSDVRPETGTVQAVGRGPGVTPFTLPASSSGRRSSVTSPPDRGCIPSAVTAGVALPVVAPAVALIVETPHPPPATSPLCWAQPRQGMATTGVRNGAAERAITE